MPQRTCIALCIFATCFAISHTAWSAPSEGIATAKYQAADLIVDVRVMSVDCDGAPTMGSYSKARGEYVDIQHYVASLRVLRIERAPQDSTIQVGSELDYLFDLETQLNALQNKGGEAHVNSSRVLSAGWVGRLHLRVVTEGTELAFVGGASAYPEESNPEPLLLCSTLDQGGYDGMGYCGSEPPETQEAQESNDAVSCSWTGPSPANNGWAWFALPLVGLFALRRRKK